jgi:hypothetical protein
MPSGQPESLFKHQHARVPMQDEHQEVHHLPTRLNLGLHPPSSRRQSVELRELVQGTSRPAQLPAADAHTRTPADCKHLRAYGVSAFQR